MKLFDIIRDANANLLRNKVRSFLTILAIFIGSFAIITNTAIQTGVNQFIDDQISSYGGEGYLMISGAAVADAISGDLGPSTDLREYGEDDALAIKPINQDTIEKVKQIDGIIAENVHPARNISISYITSDKTDKKYQLDAQSKPDGNINVVAEAGQNPDNSVTDENQIMLMPDYVEALGFASAEDAVGQTVTLGVVDEYSPDKDVKEFEAKVVGVIAPGVVSLGYNFTNITLEEKIYEENSKYYPEAEKNAVYSLTASYDYKNYNIEDIKAQLEELDLSAMTIDDLIGTIQSFFNIMSSVLNIFGAIALAAAAIGIINTLFMSVQERTREIGLNKALGMSSARIFANFSAEAIMLGFWGSVVGIIISMIAGNALNNYFHGEGQMLAAFPTFTLVQYPIENLISITVIIMLIAFLAGTIPARQASRKNPIDALRYE